MPTPSRRHSNAEFAHWSMLILVEVAMMVILGYLLIGDIDEIKGVKSNLPTYQYLVATDTLFIPERQILHLELLADHVVCCEGIIIALADLPPVIHGHHLTMRKAKCFAYIELRTAPGAIYADYLTVYDIIRQREIDDLKQLALMKYGYFDELPYRQRKGIRGQKDLSFIEWIPQENGELKRSFIELPRSRW